MLNSNDNIIDADKAIERLKSFLNIKTDSKLAKYLGVAHKTVSTWKYRNRLDIDLIISKCSNINLDWLLLGKEITTSANSNNDTDNQILLEEIKRLKKEIEVLTIKNETLKELLQDFSGQNRRIDLRATGRTVNDIKNTYATKHE